MGNILPSRPHGRTSLRNCHAKRANVTWWPMVESLSCPRFCMSRVILILCLGFSALLPAAEPELYLTGIFEVGGLRRALVFDAASGATCILAPGRQTAGLRLLELDSQAGSARIQRGEETWELSLPKAGSRGSLAAALAGGELAPDFEGAWPPGYEPDIIRRHKAGTLNGDYETSLPAGQRASRRYLSAIKQYAATLPASERTAFYSDYLEHSQTQTLPVAAFSATANSDHAPSDYQSVDQPAKAQVTMTGSGLLQQLLGTSPPEIGSQDGGPAYLAELKRLLQAQAGNPAAQRRVIQEIYGNSPWLRPPPPSDG